MWQPTLADPTADRPVYRQAADNIRSAIRTGALAPGDRLPGQERLADAFGIGVDAVRDALEVLRREGLIVTAKGVGSTVRARREMTAIRAEPGMTVQARPAVEAECHRFGIPEGSPVLVVTHAGEVQVYPGDRYEVVVPD